jgi:hypothetical protein
MMRYWKLFKRWLANIRNKGNLAETAGPGPSTNGSHDVEMVKGLVGMIEKTQEIEIDCSQVYRLLDQYTELVLRGEDPGELMPLVKQHLDLCMDCHEEYEVLLKMLEAGR